MKNIRPDIVIAVCALIISALATGASWWQSRVVARQLSAQVWPYVSVVIDRSEKTTELTLSNDGLGPAIIESFVIRVDGKPQRDVVDAILALVGRVKHVPGQTMQFGASTIRRGAVLRVGAALDVVKLENPAYAAAFLAVDGRRLDMSVCYCAIVGECFLKDHADSSPVGVASCPAAKGQLGEPAPNSNLRL